MSRAVHEPRKSISLVVRVNNQNTKKFSAALHLLNKVGKDVVLEVEEGNLVLRSLNDSKSAFVSATLNKFFFDEFQAEAANFSCKVAVKPICAIMRNLKVVQFLNIRAESTEGMNHELVFEMLLNSGMRKTHKFNYSDCEIISAIFDESSASTIRSEPKLFTQLLDHFYQSPEISIEASSNAFQVRSYHQDSGAQDPSLKKHMTTGLAVSVAEFDEYIFISRSQRGEEEGGGYGDDEQKQDDDDYEELVFCCKELRAMLGYCEAVEVPDFNMFFTQSGRPIKLSCRGENCLVDLVLATLEVRRGANRRNRSSINSSNPNNNDSSREVAAAAGGGERGAGERGGGGARGSSGGGTVFESTSTSASAQSVTSSVAEAANRRSMNNNSSNNNNNSNTTTTTVTSSSRYDRQVVSGSSFAAQSRNNRNNNTSSSAGAAAAGNGRSAAEVEPQQPSRVNKRTTAAAQDDDDDDNNDNYEDNGNDVGNSRYEEEQEEEEEEGRGGREYSTKQVARERRQQQHSHPDGDDDGDDDQEVEWDASAGAAATSVSSRGGRDRDDLRGSASADAAADYAATNTSSSSNTSVVNVNASALFSAATSGSPIDVTGRSVRYSMGGIVNRPDGNHGGRAGGEGAGAPKRRKLKLVDSSDEDD